MSAETPEARTNLSALEWLLGTWTTRDDDGRTAREEWRRKGDAFEGTSRIIAADGGIVHDEQLRLEVTEDGSIVYVANPMDQATARFHLVALRADPRQQRWTAVFENSEHDFPQRIRYERQGEQLRAVVESLDGSKRLDFEWTRAPAEVAEALRGLTEAGSWTSVLQFFLA